MHDTYFKNPHNEVGGDGADSSFTRGRLTLIQAEREKEIGLGTAYPFGKLEKGECLVNSAWMKDNNMTVGENLQVEIHYMGSIDSAVQEYYNRLAAQNGWPIAQKRPIDTTLQGTCQIVGKLSQTYGKYPASDYQSTLIMEYDTWLQWAVEESNNERPAQFDTWVDANPQILSSFADMLMYNLP